MRTVPLCTVGGSHGQRSPVVLAQRPDTGWRFIPKILLQQPRIHRGRDRSPRRSRVTWARRPTRRSRDPKPEKRPEVSLKTSRSPDEGEARLAPTSHAPAEDEEAGVEQPSLRPLTVHM